MAPFPTANPLVGLTIWMSARFCGAAGSAGGRNLGHPACAVVDDGADGAGVAVVVEMPPALLSWDELELQAAARTKPAARRARRRWLTTPSWLAVTSAPGQAERLSGAEEVDELAPN